MSKPSAAAPLIIQATPELCMLVEGLERQAVKAQAGIRQAADDWRRGMERLAKGWGGVAVCTEKKGYLGVNIYFDENNIPACWQKKPGAKPENGQIACVPDDKVFTFMGERINRRLNDMADETNAKMKEHLPATRLAEQFHAACVRLTGAEKITFDGLYEYKRAKEEILVSCPPVKGRPECYHVPLSVVSAAPDKGVDGVYSTLVTAALNI